MWYRSRRPKNWMTAMAVLFAVVGVIVILRDIALWGPEFVTDFFINDKINSEKMSLVAFGVAIILFIAGRRMEVEFYR